MTPFTLALPAGRLAEESIDFFKRSQIATFDLPKETRELLFYDTTGAYRIVLLRSLDVPTYVLQGGADAGIAGRDILAERGYDLTVPLELNFGRCRLVLATTRENIKNFMERHHVTVATKYPRITQDYFFKKGISCEVIKLHGSIEIAPMLGLADGIVDLVSTGATLKANGLLALDDLLQSSAMLVVNRSVFALQTEKINYLIGKFRAELNRAKGDISDT